MDNGEGHLEILEAERYAQLLEEKPNRTDIFSVGEEVQIKDSRFRITKITPKKLTLRILPRDKGDG